MRRSASAQSRATVAASRARRGVRTAVAGRQAMLAAYAADPALAAMRLDFTATLREVLEVLTAGLLARTR